jgi:hypothetical protein
MTELERQAREDIALYLDIADLEACGMAVALETELAGAGKVRWFYGEREGTWHGGYGVYEHDTHAWRF